MSIKPPGFCRTLMALRCLMIPIIVGLFLLHLPGGTVRFAAAEPAVGPLSEERVEQAIRDLGFEPGRSMFANGSPYPGVGSLVIGGGKGSAPSPRPREESYYSVNVYFSSSDTQLQAAIKGFSLARDASRTWSGFARYAWEVVNPFASHSTVNLQGIVQLQPRAARAVFTQAATEIFVGLGVPATGEKYEALLNQILSVAVDIAAERVGEGAERLAKRFQDLQIGDRLQAAVVAEKARYAQLDSQQYLVDLLNRAWLRTFVQMGAFHRALVNTKHLDIRASLARQMAETKRLSVTWAAAAELSQRARTLRASLRDTLQDPKGLRARLVGVHRALAAATLPAPGEGAAWPPGGLRMQPALGPVAVPVPRQCRLGSSNRPTKPPRCC